MYELMGTVLIQTTTGPNFRIFKLEESLAIFQKKKKKIESGVMTHTYNPSTS